MAKSKLRLEQKRMKGVVKSFKRYVKTYDTQPGYLDYEDVTYIEDILYGLGTSLDPEKYSFAKGFSEFKKFLIEHIKAHS